MHIGVITHNFPRFPGDYSGNFVAYLSEALAREGNRVTILAPWDAAYRPPPPDSQVDRFLWRYAPRADWHRLGYMRTMEADVKMRGETYWLAPGFFAAGTLATLQWCLINKPDVLHAHWLLPGGFFGAVASRLLGIPLVVSIPGSDALVARQNPVMRSMAKFVLDQADLITANSGSLRDVAVNELGADPRRFELIIYGVDPRAMTVDRSKNAELRAELGVAPDELLLLAVGRMVYKKGFDVLIRAMAMIKQSGVLETGAALPKLRLAFVGEGDLWQEWQELARDLGVDEDIVWPGTVPFDQMQGMYNAADVLVMPSVTRPATGLSVTVLDAMACGKPIIGSTAAGNPLVVREGHNGYIVPEGDPAALAGAILRFAALPCETREEMGKKSRRLVEEQFAWEHLARRYLENFKRLAAGRVLLGKQDGLR
ncbi:MAG: glycosyltransferase [Chloroflexota bacterium]|nr:glycosyltransferase [Chloroflexota bacterium]